VGLDVTHRATFTPVELALLDERRTPAAAFCAGPVRFYRPQGSTLVPDGSCPCHDFVAMMAAVDDDLVQGPVVPVSVDLAGGPAWGATVADLRQPLFAARGVASQGDPVGSPCQVGLEVDVARFRRTARTLFGG
jgi:inosine-uridine nucleoside N-ribohydrolase